MKILLRRLAKFKAMTAGFALSFLFIAAGWLWAYIILRKINQPIILHFNNFLGITRIGNLTDLAETGIFGLLMAVINFLLAFNLEERDWFLGKLMAAATLFFGILIFIGFAAIISVN
jgi:hypothetical protein